MNTDFTVAQKVLHWLMALILMLDLFVAQKFGNVMEITDRLDSRIDHASLGTIVCLLFLGRLYLRFKHGGAELPSAMPLWQQRLAKSAHVLLYVLIATLLVTGLMTAMNAASPLPLFGQIDVTLGQTDEQTFDFIRQFHELATEAIIVLIGLHIVAALYHGILKRDGTTSRMVKFWKSSRAQAES